MKYKFSSLFITGTTIDWRLLKNEGRVEKTIENLQPRITKATKRGEHRKIRDLQRLLNRSLAAGQKAVCIVAQETSGKKTPKIDGEIWTTPDRKLLAALELRKKFLTKTFRPIYIPIPGPLATTIRDLW